jgi:hypothetical protein
MRLVVITFAALGLGLPLAGGAMPLRIPSGVHGVVMRGPIKPVCPEEQSCEEPAAGIVLRFSRAGQLVTWVKTDRAGMYTVRLRPGSYSVTTAPRAVGTGLTPHVVRVPRARLARADFHLDTGLQ